MGRGRGFLPGKRDAQLLLEHVAQQRPADILPAPAPAGG